MEAPTSSSSKGHDNDGTSTPSRNAEVANPGEKRASSESGSVTSEATVLKLEPSIETLSDKSSDSGNDVYTTHGLQLALNSTIPLPSRGDLTKRALKSDKYRTSCSDFHDEFLAALNGATKAYKTIAAKRDRHNFAADPDKAAALNHEYFEASKNLSKAEREYHGYAGFVNELRTTPQMTKAEAKLYDERKRKEKDDREYDAEMHLTCDAEIRDLKRQVKKNQDTIAYLTEQKESKELEAMRSILAQRREITELTAQNLKLAEDAGKLITVNNDLKSLNGFLTRQNASFESHPGYCNPAWEDPNVDGVQNAMAARHLAMTISEQFTGSDRTIATQPIKDTKSEILLIQKLLMKHSVIYTDPCYAKID